MTKPRRPPIEVMAPVGSLPSLHAAIKAGAHAVYLGVHDLNMRAQAAHNFHLRDLPGIADKCHEKGLKAYLTLNTVIFDDDRRMVEEICLKAAQYHIDAVIASDVAVMQCARRLGLQVHLSVQANVANTEALKFFSQYADVVVLARELNLEQIRTISRAVHEQQIRGPSGHLVRLELFVHGALCMAFSGRCFLSLGLYNASANRGACLQPCRRQYLVKDVEEGTELLVDNDWVLSPQDLCTIECLDKIVSSGVSVLKIEGRGKPPEYVYTVTKAYVEAVQSVLDGTFSREKAEEWKESLKTVYNRGFWEGGYYLGNPSGGLSGSSGSQATKKKLYVGPIMNYFVKPSVAEVLIQDHPIKEGDEYLITGPTTGIVQGVLSGVRAHTVTSTGKEGTVVTFKVQDKIRRSDKLYLLVDR